MHIYVHIYIYLFVDIYEIRFLVIGVLWASLKWQESSLKLGDFDRSMNNHRIPGVGQILAKKASRAWFKLGPGQQEMGKREDSDKICLLDLFLYYAV